MRQFDSEWFARHQTAMLLLANTYYGRRLLRIEGDLPRKSWIVGIQPHAFTWTTEPLIPFLRRARRGEPVTLTSDFRTQDKFTKRLIHDALPKWERVREQGAAVWRPLGVREAWADTLTAYPQAGSGGANVTCDGVVYRQGVNETLATIRAGAGTTVATDASRPYFLQASTTSNQFQILMRTIATFDTSSLSSSANISAATCSPYGSSKTAGLGAEVAHIVSATPASNAALVIADYSQLGATSFASIAYAAWSDVAYNAFSLDANGIANISKTSISKFGFRGEWDLNNSFTGVWVDSAASYIVAVDADTAGTASDPKLVVTFTLPTGHTNVLLMGVG